jgi:hypothetical protein
LPQKGPGLPAEMADPRVGIYNMIWEHLVVSEVLRKYGCRYMTPM